MNDHQESELEALERILTDTSAAPAMLSFTVIKSITKNFSKEIGRGGFGVVYLGALRNGMVAVKMLSTLLDMEDKQFVDEINCLIRAKHKNIVRLLGYCADTQGEMMKFNGRYVLVDRRQRFLCFEYAHNGSLDSYLEEQGNKIDWKTRYQLIQGICQGLHYLHNERINHLDLKPQNVLLDARMQPKITDFGLSRCFDGKQSRMITRNICGTPGYIAPELIDSGVISFKSDIYSLGMVIMKISAGTNMHTSRYRSDISSDPNCIQMKTCIEIAQNCIDTERNRPSIGEIIHKLNEIDTIIQKAPSIVVESTNGPGSSIPHQEVPTDNFKEMTSIDVHPTEPWILTGHWEHVCIWKRDMQGYTLEKSLNYIHGRYRFLPVPKFIIKQTVWASVVKFVARRRWILVGDSCGDIEVYSSPALELMNRFHAHLGWQVGSLAVHPTKPYVLSSSSQLLDCVIKLWDWDKGWVLTQQFRGHSRPPMQVAFKPNDPNTFASVSRPNLGSPGNVKIWNIESAAVPNSDLHGGFKAFDFSATVADCQYMVTIVDNRSIEIWDLQTERCIQTLEDSRSCDINVVACHPTLPLIITGSEDGNVCVWNLCTYRLEYSCTYAQSGVKGFGFIDNAGYKRLVIGYDKRVVLVEIDLLTVARRQ